MGRSSSAARSSRTRSSAGTTITLFNRGETNPELFPDAEKLRGDRDGDLAPLEGREWDAVLDASGYLPRVVRASAELLADRAAHYTFVSSISVYSDFSEPAAEDDTPLIRLDDTRDESLEGERYGGFKALCERAVADVFPERSALVRPGLIVGPNDPTRRFTYWPKRVAQGGEVLAPGRRGRQVQFIDVRDLASWLVDLGERRTDGTFNATGPVPPVTMGELLETCRAVSGSDARFTWVDDAFLRDEEVGRVDGAATLARRERPGVAPVPGGRRHAGGRGGPVVPPARRDGARHARVGGGHGRPGRAARERRRPRPSGDGTTARGGAARRVARSAQMSDKDYSGTPLSQKLGAKPGAGVVVFFTTSRDDLERRFDGLKATLAPADGLWVAWPKKAAKIATDLDFETVQGVGLENGLVDNKSCAIDERWQALRFVYRLEDR